MKTRAHLIFLAGLMGLGMLSGCYRRDDNYNSNPGNGSNNYGSHTYDTTASVFDEEFSATDQYPWAFTDATDSAYASIANGYYEYVDYSTLLSNLTVVNSGISTAGNFSVVTRVKSNNIIGLIFGASTTNNGYAFYMDTAGNYSLYQEGSGSTASTVVIPSTQDTTYALKDNWNTLELDQANGTWTGFINGTQVFSITARTLSGNDFGFKVLPLTIGYADYITVKSSN